MMYVGCGGRKRWRFCGLWDVIRLVTIAVLCVCVEGGQELEMDEDSLRLWLHMAVGRRAEGEASAKTLNSFRLASIAASH